MTFEEWKSETPEAIKARAACYLAEMLNALGAKRDESLISAPPSYPSFWFYDVKIDAPVWLEVKSPIHARDYARAFPERLNAGANDLIKSELEKAA